VKISYSFVLINRVASAATLCTAIYCTLEKVCHPALEKDDEIFLIHVKAFSYESFVFNT